MKISNTENLRRILAEDGYQNEAVRLKWLNRMSNDHYLTDSTITYRGVVHDRIVNNTRNGKVAVRIWSRDCGHCESEYIKWIEPSLYAVEQERRDLEKDAEGPYSVTVLTLAEADEFEPTTRDRILEAWENGQAYRVGGAA